MRAVALGVRGQSGRCTTCKSDTCRREGKSYPAGTLPAGVRAFTSAMVMGVTPRETIVYGRCDPGDHRKAGAHLRPTRRKTAPSAVSVRRHGSWNAPSAKEERLTGAVAGISRKVVSRCYV